MWHWHSRASYWIQPQLCKKSYRVVIFHLPFTCHSKFMSSAILPRMRFRMTCACWNGQGFLKYSLHVDFLFLIRIPLMVLSGSEVNLVNPQTTQSWKIRDPSTTATVFSLRSRCCKAFTVGFAGQVGSSPSLVVWKKVVDTTRKPFLPRYTHTYIYIYSHLP